MGDWEDEAYGLLGNEDYDEAYDYGYADGRAVGPPATHTCKYCGKRDLVFHCFNGHWRLFTEYLDKNATVDEWPIKKRLHNCRNLTERKKKSLIKRAMKLYANRKLVLH